MRTYPPQSSVRASRRKFLFTGTGVAAGTLFFQSVHEFDSTSESLPPAFGGLKPLGSRARPITADEFRGRLELAQRLMAEPPSSGAPAVPANPAASQGRKAAGAAAEKFDALFFAPGTSLYYFTGIRWGLSERLVALVLPRAGHPVVVAPAFEEGRLREQLKFPMEVRVWQEDESPTRLAAAALSDQGIRTGRVGIEETTGFTFFEHFRQAAPGFEFACADPITIACRGRKSTHELELMRLACEATFDVFRAVFASIKEGMSQHDISHLVEAGFSQMELHGGALVLLGASAALPHGTLKPQKLKEGDVILIDGGCAVEGYQSDVTRTSLLGKPSEKVSRAFELVRKAQDAALDAARAGKFSGTVDDAARAVITGAGYGPDYKFFTHRLGHGIGLDGHEHPYLVRGSKTVLEPGMTFSNEPGIYVPGEFGLRCEDDMVITAGGPAQLLTPRFAPSLEKPFG